MNNLEQHFKTAAEQPALPLPTGTRLEVGMELIRRCQERDIRLEKQALEAERDGDTDGCWLAMATRAQNKRVWDKIQADLDNDREANHRGTETQSGELNTENKGT